MNTLTDREIQRERIETWCQFRGFTLLFISAYDPMTTYRSFIYQDYYGTDREGYLTQTGIVAGR